MLHYVQQVVTHSVSRLFGVEQVVQTDILKHYFKVFTGESRISITPA